MEPVALTFRHNGWDKYGKERQGDVMLVHLCKGCGEVNINRIAGDDSCEEIMALFERSLSLDEGKRDFISQKGIALLEEKDRTALETSLFGALFHQ